MSDVHRIQVTVIGAGISGLAAAQFLTHAGYDVCVIEKSDRTGGTIETKHVDGFLVDTGPNSGLETTPLLGELFEQVGVTSSVRYANDLAKNRYILKNGTLHALPMKPGAFVKTPLFSASAKLRLLREPFIRPSAPDADESLATFVTRRLGTEFLDYAINPFVSGVYAGVPERLSVRSAFPKLHEIEQQYGSLIKGTIKGMKERKRRAKRGEQSRAAARMFSFVDGMQTVVDGLARELGKRVVTGTTPRVIERRGDGFAVHVDSEAGQWTLESDAVVLAIPGYAYPSIEFGMEFPLTEQLNAIPYPPVAVVFFGYKNNPAQVPLDGFGYLIPQREKRGSLGTIWNSTLFPQRAPDGGVSLTTFVGGSRQPDNALLDEGGVIDLVRNDLKDILGITALPDTAVVRCWERAIPQYNVGHSRIVAAIERFEEGVPGLYISGNFRGGVSISDCVRQAHDMAERVSTRLGISS
jgi:oxygen-dependent protoporphyrinogen oxidase